MHLKRLFEGGLDVMFQICSKRGEVTGMSHSMTLDSDGYPTEETVRLVREWKGEA